MKVMIHILCVTALAGAIFFVAGCFEDDSDGVNNPFFKQAEQAMARGEYQEAADYLRRFLRFNPNSAAGLFTMATICDENLKDYVSAVYYYELYLALPDESLDRELANGLLRHAKVKAREQISQELGIKEVVAAPMTEALPQVPVVPEKVGPAETLPTVATAEPPLATAPARGQLQRYTVQPGDTLSAISKKFYGAGNRYDLIMEANKSILQGKTFIRPGMTLIIPPAPER